MDFGFLSGINALGGGVLGYLIPFLFVLTVVVFFHELGHFLVARWCGVRVLVFSIGFGPELFGFNDRHGFLKDFEEERYPFIMVDNYSGSFALDHVMCDYRGGAEQVMNYLLQLGHRKIALITGAPEAHTARDVIEVYETKLRAVGALPPPTMRADGRFTEDGGAKACERIFASHPDVTAVFAGNDKMALGAMHQLRRRKLDIPTDVSVVGFDDLGHSAFVNPSLTTVHLPLYEVGTLSCERLIERIHGKIDRVAEKLPTHLVVRDSTALAASVQAT